MSAKPRKTAEKSAAAKKIVKATTKVSAEDAGTASSELATARHDEADQSLLSGEWDSAGSKKGAGESMSVLETLGITSSKATAIAIPPFDRLRFRSIGPMATPPAQSERAILIGAGLPVRERASKPLTETNRSKSELLRISRELAERALLRERWELVEDPGQVSNSSTVEIGDVVANHEAKLELILELLNEPSFNPKRSRDANLAWSTISFVLSSMPHRWREDALRMMSLGASTFGKIPFAFNNPANHAEGARVTGPPRPMGCPEAAPDGSDFALAWMIGNWWDWRLPGAGEINREPTCDLNSILQTLRDCNNGELWHWRERAKYILNSLGGQAIEKLTAHHDVFRAGVNFAALILFGSDTKLVGYHTFTEECTRWPEIIRYALMRHGVQTKPQVLLRSLDPSAWARKIDHRKKTRQNGDDLEVIFEWNFVPSERITFKDIQRKITHTKKTILETRSFEQILEMEFFRRCQQ